MKKQLKRNIFSVMGLSILFMVLELFTKWRNIGVLGLGFLFVSIGMLIDSKVIRRIFYVLGLTFVIVALVTNWSVVFLLITVILFWFLYRTKNGNEFFDFDETVIVPYKNTKYAGVELIEPQSEQRKLPRQIALENVVNNDKSIYEWDDINIVMFGGSSIIDLGNTILPERENNVVLQKFFGRTRIIVSSDIGLKLNISAISGRVIFDSKIYDLAGENFRWESSDYSDYSRKINVIVSVISGDIEVIIL